MLQDSFYDSRYCQRCLCFLLSFFVASSLLFQHRMGVKDLIGKFANSKLQDVDSHQQRIPPPIPHESRPATQTPSYIPGNKPFVVVRNARLELEDGVPFRFASLNAPELLDGHEFEVEDTMRTMAGLGRKVTRTYTLKVKGTSPHFGDAGHINGWDVQRGDWMYDEAKFIKVAYSHCLGFGTQIYDRR